ncbi:hypothetical protein DTO166G4_1580 [Paecilomyces variotii]|nr:hypothetical protein DTO166G4_1580 [Paecilomyces variotii]KAJ9232316.1 hypothetical protein DTO166G5_6293 [Paecilomyces variotii]KAJ9249407.1 hypothetical protein DTO195F2_8518 [Paecilomyces variotii]KAJ9357825.1 hypothetical protein DTO027B9_2752 [Paecilomyces variotii]KAJ9372352.1 hypothetical protein DTO282E5_2939 [Paecilomyces variotii]
MAESLLLLQKPNRWTARHLEVARVRVIQDVSAAELLGDFYPEDGDPEFENIAEQLCGPSREEMERSVETMHLTYDKTALIALFEDLYMILKVDVKQYRYWFKHWLCKLVEGIQFRTSSLTGLFVNTSRRTTDIRVDIPRLSRAHMKVDCTVLKFNKEEDSLTIPLAVLSIIKTKCEESVEISRYEAPQCLAQTIMAYSRNPGLEQYYGFVINLDRTVLQISKAVVGQAYLKSFWEDGSITEDIQLHRAKKLDLLDRDGRREFSRLIIGISKFILANEQSKIIQEGLH